MNMQRWLQFEQAKSMVAESEASLDRDLQNLVVRVAGAYFEYLMADEQLDLVLAQKKLYTSLVDAAKKVWQLARVRAPTLTMHKHA